MTQKKLMLQKFHSQPPPSFIATARSRGESNMDLIIRIDRYNNCELWQPMRDSWLTPTQQSLVSAIEKASGWDPITHKPIKET